MTRPSIFFRLDASPQIGLGHLRRCCVLAKACGEQGAISHFFIRHQQLDLEGQPFPPDSVIHDIPWDATAETDADLTIQLCQQHTISVGVVDHYRFPPGYQEKLNAAGLRWMQFGNHLHTHPLKAALVHDASPGAEGSTYARRIPPDQQAPHFLTGPSYALVDEAFRQQRAQLSPPSTRGIDTLLLTFGGGNDRGATLAALTWLDAAGYTGKRLILTTHLNPSLPELEEKARQSEQIELHLDNWQPAPLMARCQLAICAGGTSLHELACLGVPPIIICIADNQIYPAQAWQKAGMSVNLGMLQDITETTATNQLRHLLQHPHKTTHMAQLCWQAQDGRGAERVAQALLMLERSV